MLAAACAPPPAGPVADDGPRGERFNVLLISLDTTRADHIGAYGQSQGATPHIDRLAAEGTLFEHCVSPVPITLPAHASLMTAVDPFVHEVRYNGFPLGPRLATLAERLRAAGWATAAEIGGYVLDREYGLDRGFDDYRDVDGERLERPGDEVADAALERIDALAAGGRPFFLFVHLFDPHEPYAAPAPWSGRFASPYLDEIAFADAQVGRLLEGLDAAGAGERTLVVLLGDHGESLGEHGEDTHSFFVYDATTAVPLVLRAPGLVPAARRVPSQARLIDVAPTILAFLGLEPFAGAQGVDLRPMLGEPALELVLPAYSETFYPKYSFGYSPLRALRAGGWKYVHAPAPELYRLADDPGELHDLAAQEPERTRRMRDALRRWIAEAPKPRDDGDAGDEDDEGETPGDIDPEQLARLQSLGYLGGSAASLAIDDELAQFEPAGADPKDRVELMRLSARAVILDRDGERAEAERLLRRAIEIAPEGGGELAAVHGLLGTILFATGRPEESIEQFRARLESGWNPGDTRTRLAGALIAVGRHEEAIGELEAAFGEGSAVTDTWLYYGVALAAAGRAGEAEAAYREAVERDPENLLARRSLAEALIGARRGEEALEQYRLLAARTPDDARVQRGLGLALLQLERPQEALQPLERATELDPGAPRAWYSLSAAQAAAGRTEQAVRSAERAAREAEAAGDPAFAAHIRASIEQLRR
jgi:arylsulfatase A-like enzyme/tetratricopeptide (TPR) repeat protein